MLEKAKREQGGRFLCLLLPPDFDRQLFKKLAIIVGLGCIAAFFIRETNQAVKSKDLFVSRDSGYIRVCTRKAICHVRSIP